ncbi:MAG: DMT family transporter [Actinomycetota bacterium]
MLGAVLALGSSVLWGTADFLGGSLSRRLPVLTVMLASQGAALAALVLAVPLAGGLLAPGRYLLWGVSYGLIGMVALTAFYRALATGTMGIVAPIAATGVVIPVLVGLADGDRPKVHQFVGMALAAAGILLASAAQGAESHEAGSEAATAARRSGVQSVLLAMVAAVGFGTVLVLIERGSRTSVGMTLLAARSATVVLLVAFLAIARPLTGPWRPNWRLLVGIGLLDIGANGAFALAGRRGALSEIAVLGSLYPVMTVLLARCVHAERLSRAQAAGVATALAGIVLIAAT